VFQKGHRLLIELAAAAVGDARLDVPALLDGCFREDRFSIGFTHFAYAAPWRAQRLYARAVRERSRAGFYWLGRAAHLVGEMAAPAHAQSSYHWYGEPFELYVESHAGELRALRAADVAPADARSLARGLAERAQQVYADRTRNVPGYIAYKLGLRRRPTDAEVEEQARALVPLGAGYTAALFARFLEETSA
jgi:hypothetical protein